MTAIYGKTHHPVFVKKISLGLWSLRDEIESIILEKLNEYGVTDPADLTPEQLEEIKNFYRAKENKQNSNVLQFVKKEEASAPAATEALEAKVEETAQEMTPPADGENPEAKPEEEKKEETPPVEAATGDVTTETTIPTEENKEATPVEAAPAATTTTTTTDTAVPIPAEIKKLNKETSPFRKKPALLDPSKQSSGVMVLSDVNMDEILLFSKLPFEYGQAIVIEFLIPQYFVVGAEVLSCNRYNLKSRIINPSRPEYRIRAKFNFQTVGERTLLRAFLKSIEPEIPVVKKKKVQAEETSADDDLSELGI